MPSEIHHLWTRNTRGKYEKGIPHPMGLPVHTHALLSLTPMTCSTTLATHISMAIGGSSRRDKSLCEEKEHSNDGCGA
jgi:hypothetical protein